VEERRTRKGDDSSLDTLLSEGLDGLNTDADLGSSRDEGNVGFLVLVNDVTSVSSVLDRVVLELGKVLSGQAEDGGGVLGLEGDEVGGRSLVSGGRSLRKR
jgi:hypothetical protein